MNIQGAAATMMAAQSRQRISLLPPFGYNVQARLAAFIARHRAVRVALGASDASGFTGFALPNPPTSITNFITVSNASELADACLVNNAEITFSGAGFAVNEQQIVGRNDQRYIFPPGFTLSCSATGGENKIFIIYGGFQRIEFLGTGGSMNGCIQPFNGTDLKLKGMRMVSPPGENWHNLPGDITRMLWEGCYVESDGNPILSARITDEIYANCEMRCRVNVYCIRVTESPRAIVMDNRFLQTPSGYAVRVQSGTALAGLWNNQIENSSTLAGIGVLQLAAPALNVTDFVVLDNNIYSAGYAMQTPYEYPPNPNITLATIYGNTGYNDSESGSQIDFGSSGPGWLTGNNPRLAYQSPPAWSRQ